MSITKSDLIIIGSGPAGYTSAIYAARAMLDHILIQGDELEVGGQIINTNQIENYPGFSDSTSGSLLMEKMHHQAIKVGAKIVEGYIEEVNLQSKPLKLKASDGANYEAKSIIIATGAKPKKLGLEGETKYEGRGVSSCAVCDGSFYKNEVVAVIGGGNVAVEDAIYLSKIASKVILIHRRDKLRAEEILQSKLFECNNIEILWDNQLDEIIGDKNNNVSKIRIKGTKTNMKKLINVNGVFIAIGYEPQTSVFSNFLETDENGYIITRENLTKTSVEGVFAAGDVADNVYRQAITAAGLGCMAAIDAKKYLNSIPKLTR